MINAIDIMNNVGIFDDSVVVISNLNEYYWDKQWVLCIMSGV